MGLLLTLPCTMVIIRACCLRSSLHHNCTVDGGERAVLFDRFRGVLPTVSGEGTHFLVPWVQLPIIYSVRSTPRSIPVTTGSKGMTECGTVLLLLVDEMQSLVI